MGTRSGTGRLAAVAIIGVLGAALVATPVSGATETGSATKACVVAGGTEAFVSSLWTAAAVPDADGAYPYQQWLVSDTGQAATQALVGVEDSVFGRLPSTASLETKLNRGLIGFAADYATQSLVAVVTPEYAGTAELETALKEAQAGLGTGAPALRAQAGCNSAASLADAYKILLGYAWRPLSAKFAYAFDLDPVDSRFHVTVDYHQTKAADTLAALLGDRAVVTLGEAGRTGRLNDGEPHYGGAGIRKGYSSNTASNTCTSGFMVRNSSGGVAGMTAAGHCFANGDYVYSSTQYYGYASGKGVDYPTVDIMRVYSSGETYDNIIHVDPCSPCTRTVTAKSRVANGSSGLCSSGMVTRAICSLTVVSVEASVCDPYCSIGLIKVTRNGDTIVRPGDSGGPVYLRNGSTTASAVGTIVGGSSGSRYVTSTAMYIEPYGAIEGALGMYIATY